MALLLCADHADPAEWIAALKSEMPELDVRVWPEAGDPEDIDFALVWEPEPGLLRRFPNLRAICSMGAGVDHVLRDPDLPDVPLVRLVDRRLTAAMSEYVILHVLRFTRRMPEILANQRRRKWRYLPPPDTEGTPVGIMGLGELGADAGRKLAMLGFPVLGWSRTEKRLPGIESMHGAEALFPFLGRCRILVCLLPLTPATHGLIDARALAALPEGAFLINAGRGAHVVDEDLLAALDSGRLAGAVLDVFVEEPLPPDHPYWTHPKVTVTPHNASDTIAASAAPQIVDNVRRARAGRPLLNVVDRRRGY